jgi:ABC-type branched-subunit amino acid transport system substrate-binding protein
MISVPTRTRRAVAVAGAASLLLVAAACGGNSGSGSGGPTQNANIKFTGDPITLMTISSWDNDTIDYIDPATVAKGAGVALNNQGGINGHEVKVITCNDSADPNKAADCAREAVTDKVAAVVGGFTTNGDQIMPILEKAGIPWMAPPLISAGEFSSKLSFPITAGVLTFAGLGQKAVQDGCKNIASLTYDLPTSASVNQLVSVGVTGAGGTFAKQIKVPPTTTDFSGIAKDVSDYDCVLVGLPPAPFVGIAAAETSLGKSTKFYIISGGLTDALVTQIGAPLDGAVSNSAFPVGDDKAWDSAKKEAGDLADSTQGGWSGPYVQNTWVGYVALANALSAATDLSAKGVATVLGQTVNVDTDGLAQPFSFASEFPVPGLNRVFNHQVLYVKVDGGKIVPDDGTYSDLASALG